MLWQTYTFNQSVATDYSQNSASSYLKGDNWEVWRDAVSSRILARGGVVDDEIVETATTIRFNGESLIDLLSLADYAVCDSHSPPLEHLLDIKAKSNLGTQVGYALFNFESINQAQPWNPVLATLRDESKGHILTPDPTSGCGGNGANGYNFDVLDKYEANDRTGAACFGSWPASKIANPPADATDMGTKHTWECDVGAGSGRYAEELADVFATDYMADYAVAGPTDYQLDFAIWDNLLNSPYVGPPGTQSFGATNDPPASYTAAYYNAGWKALLAQLRFYFDSSFIWANGPANLSAYSAKDCGYRFIEFWQRSGDGSLRTLADLQDDIDTMSSSAGVTMALGGLWTGFGDATIKQWWESTGPGGANGTWLQVRDYVADLGVEDKIIVNCGRSSSGGYLFWQPEFTDPREAV